MDEEQSWIRYGKVTPPAADPPFRLYKYLGIEGAKNFLKQPQLWFKNFLDLDDPLDTRPGFTPQTDEQARRNAIERVARNPLPNVSLEHQLIIFEELGKFPATALEEIARDVAKDFATKSAPFPFVCSLSAIPHSLAMWSLYADQHRGIVFGISPRLNRLISDKGRVLQKMHYSENRPHTAFSNAKFEEIAAALWTKGTDWAHQEEWRIMAEGDARDDLQRGEIEEVTFGYRYDPNVLGSKEEHMQQDIFSDTKFFDSFPDPTHYKMARRDIRPAAESSR